MGEYKSLKPVFIGDITNLLKTYEKKNDLRKFNLFKVHSKGDQSRWKNDSRMATLSKSKSGPYVKLSYSVEV